MEDGKAEESATETTTELISEIEAAEGSQAEVPAELVNMDVDYANVDVSGAQNPEDIEDEMMEQ